MVVFLVCSPLCATKQRSIRCPKRRPPRRHAKQAQAQPDMPMRTGDPTPTERDPTTASERKLFHSPQTASEYPSSISSSESESESEGGSRILEVSGIQSALVLQGVWGPVLFKEELHKREGLCTHTAKAVSLQHPFQSGSRSLALNERTVLANKQSYTSLGTLFVLLDLPPPVSQHAYQHTRRLSQSKHKPKSKKA